MFFKHFISGNFGFEMVDLYVEKLRNFPRLGLPNMANECFTICISVMGEVWRRFVFDKQCCPYTLFALLDTTTDEDFLRAYRDMQRSMEDCPMCTDAEFSRDLLRAIPTDGNLAELKPAISTLRNFLEDVTIFTPVSSDLVECLHGFQQGKVHRFRGCKPSDPAAQEICMLSTIQSSYNRFWNCLWETLGDKSARHRLHRFGQKGNNQYTDKDKTKDPRTTSFWKMENMDRICQKPKAVRTPRKLSGFSAIASHGLSNSVGLIVHNESLKRKF